MRCIIVQSSIRVVEADRVVQLVQRTYYFRTQPERGNQTPKGNVSEFGSVLARPEQMRNSETSTPRRRSMRVVVQMPSNLAHIKKPKATLTEPTTPQTPNTSWVFRMVEAGRSCGRCSCCTVAGILVADSERCDTVHLLSGFAGSVFGRLAGPDLVVGSGIAGGGAVVVGSAGAPSPAAASVGV
jgi:hypothetical protein